MRPISYIRTMIRSRSFLFALALLSSMPPAAPAQTTGPRPLVRPGEELVFRVRSARFGDVGKAIMRVAGEDTIDGRSAYRLTFDFRARFLLFKVSDRTRSWLDAQTLSTLRYRKSERSPIGGRQEAVDVNPADSSWSENGVKRPLASLLPLDELAFIYLVRDIDALAARPMQLERHFDAARNPVHLCVLGQQTIEALGQSLEATVVQMDVPDARQDGGRSQLRFYIGAGPERLVLRIDTSMPVGGALTLTLMAVHNAPPGS
jgi:hypothetical protein